MTTVKQETLRTPLDPVNWPEEPNSLQELEEAWIPATRANLLKWLTDATRKAEDEKERDQILRLTNDIVENWKKMVPRADAETGLLPDNLSNDEKVAMTESMDKLSRVHEDLKTGDNHDDRRGAQEAWEDFLYYQNAWNRRSLLTEDRVQKAKENASPYVLWRYRMIELYDKYQLGSRQNLPKLVGPDIAHRYSQPPRGTMPRTLKSYRDRKQRLQKQFPVMKPTVISDEREDVKEKIDKTTAVVQGENELEEREEQRNTDWMLDQATFALEQKICDKQYLLSPRTKALLPKDHVLHHGVLETSFDWPTSFDAEEWGDTIAVTATKRTYVYGKEEYQADNGRRRVRHKRDAEGRHLRIKETCGYKKTSQTKQVDSFIHALNEDGSVQGRNENGTWAGQPGKEEVVDYVYDLEDGERAPDVRYRSRNEIRVVNVKAPWPIITRYQRHLHATNAMADGDGDAPLDQLSDDEPADCIKSNANFSRSGNVKLDVRASNARSAVDGNESAGDDDESEIDDEGDWFTQSYLRCSARFVDARKRSS